VLGDAGSLFLRSAVLRLTTSGSVRRIRCAEEPQAPLAVAALPFEIYQESSGGDRWNANVHRNRHGRVPLRFRGYRLHAGTSERTANRASPIVAVDYDEGQLTIAVPQFWENFPRAISVEGSTVEVGLFPRQFDDEYELQGGEQKTHEIVVAFGEDTVSDPPLAWCHDPLIVSASPEWCCESGAVPFLVPSAQDDSDNAYVRLTSAAFDPERGFFAKRERADEFGWRNSGDLPADHESGFRPPGELIVSHYNNQYDAMAAFACQFLRSGDTRWWRLMADLARHVRDIDIYHTREDKAAYAGGLFWHTQHYTDADTSTHRTYPRGSGGGGPSAEHNYNAGLMLHFFLTGERSSRDAAIGLGQWVIDMDDGRKTPFRLLAGGATGLASATGSMAYHGPGRGPANSILACLVAHRLSGDAQFIVKADELIMRCIHPDDDLEARRLLDVESRWYYTVFLQALGSYLHDKSTRREFDRMFDHARGALLHYARWMAVHERPYLDRPEVLEFPTETWAAQDVRKADVFLWAAQHADGVERELFLERARFFFEYSVSTLSASPTHHFTRPLVLMLANGQRYGWAQKQHAEWPAPVGGKTAGHPIAFFEPQKARAVRRAKWLLALVLGTGVTWLAAAYLFDKIRP
jgi:hypothetical protein